MVGETPQGALMRHLRRAGVAGDDVLAAMARVPRDVFVGEPERHRAYEDRALPIGGGQTISQPTVVALMTEALRVGPADSVLEVGTGSGYQTAILAELARAVHSVERLPPLAARAARLLAFLGYDNVTVHTGDGSRGWPPAAPYDCIAVTAAGPEVPARLIDQLAPGGRLVAPVGSMSAQRLVVITRDAAGHLHERTLGTVQFVPLVGEFGWPAD